MIKNTLAALGLAFTTSPAALTLPPAPAIEIAVDAATLADPAQTAELRIRIAEAARQVCREYLIGDLLRAYTLHECIETTTAQAMSQLEALRTASLTETEAQPQ